MCVVGFFILDFMLALVPIMGDVIKGSRRWLTFFGFTIQPSELLKPFYITFSGILLAIHQETKRIIPFVVLILLHTVICILLLLEPDLGMTVVFTILLASQLFIAGFPIKLLFTIAITGITLIVFAYCFLPHVTNRIDNFLKQNHEVNYQVEKSLQSYETGGLFGKGPGEGNIKTTLPDAHTDFIFAVVAEEMGSIFCIILLCIFAFVILRGLYKLESVKNRSYYYSAFGILICISVHTIFNVGVTLNLFPVKGMTLPFISYGGSSALSFSISAGLYLFFTKKRNSLYIKPHIKLLH